MAMNFNHKCHFHPDNSIIKFCPLQACTLPLCQNCETIHLQEHKVNSQEVKLMRFNQAYLNATNLIENYLEQEKKSYRQMQRHIENDKQAVLKFIGNYYSQATKTIDQFKNKLNTLEEKLAKLKKGSIKTLIFYYSGDIKLEKNTNKFQPLIEKINPPHYTTQSLEEYQLKAITKQSQKRQNSNTKLVRNNNQYVSRPPKIALDENVFEGIQQPKITEKQRQKRKCIFDNAKKSTILQAQPRQRVNKYNYNIQNQKETDMLKVSPTFKNTNKNNIDTNQFVNKQIIYKIERKEEPLHGEIKMSYQNQMMNKFTGAEQYQAYKKQREQKLFQQINYHQNKSIQERQSYQHKILKTSDLQVDKINQNFTHNNYQKLQETKQNLGQRNFTDQSVLRTERLRSMSHAVIVNRESKETSKENVAYDLKKQVLSPHQIRKMLQKRIEERNNKILSMKKTQIPSGVEDMKGTRNWGETKNSIINQIYEPKY